MASTEGVNIVISGDSSQAVNEVEKVSKAIDGVKGTIIKITADSSQAVGEADKVASSVENINDSHVEITVDSSQAVGEAEKVSNAVQHIGDAHANITADGSQAVDEARKVANAEESIKDAHSNITADGSQALNEAKNVITIIEKLDGKAAKLAIQAKASQAIGEVMSLQDAIKSINTKIKLEFSDADIKRQLQNLLDFRAKNTFSVKFKEGFKDFSKAVDDFGKKLEAGFRSIFKTITAGAMSVAGTLSMITKSALSIGGGFESVMTSVRVISGAEEKDMDALIKKAREMGATLPITAKDAATAMQLLAQRGTSAKDILASVSEVANLAIAQGVDMGSAAELLGTAMSSFGLDISEAAKVTAIFNNACNQSALNIDRLMTAMKYAAPAAGSLGVSITEAVAAMEAISKTLPSGEMTGTGYAMVLSKIAAKSEIAGIRTKNLDGSLRSIKDIFLDLKEANVSYDVLNKVFGVRGVKAALALQQFAGSLEENEEKLKNWVSTQAAVDAKAKTFTNTIAALRSAIEELHIEIFEQIKDQSKEAVGGIAELTRAFSKWGGETQIAGKSLNAFLQGLGFNIPSIADFERLLKQFNVQAFVDRVKSFGSTLRGIGESIAGMFDKIKTPLLWLINNLETFAQISFWGWIVGKGLQIPAAILGIASSFTMLANSLKGLLGLSWASLAGLLTNPIMLGVAATGIAVYAGKRLSDANEELRKALDEEKRYLQEQAKADFTLPVDIQFDFKTGFEKLPESWAKASDKVREEANATVKELQDNFRVKVAGAVDFVSRKFPELADAIKDMGTVSNSTLRQITAALQGDEKAFEALPKHLQKVTEHINAVDSGLVQLGIDFYGISKKYREFKQEVEKPIAKKDEGTVFFEEMAASIKSIMTNLPAEIERANKFLSGSNGQLAVQVSFTQAEKKLDAFVKTASEKYSLPEDIVKESTIKRLNDLAQAGNATAQSLINGWNSAGNALDTFLSDAKDAINYLGASPENFIPALNKLMNGIQKLDPITGKVTAQFKKAHDALKQWSDTNFNNLLNRIGKLRKAVENGFLDKSYLEEEIKAVAPKIKLQIVKELEPMRGQWSEKAYLATVASELLSKFQEIAGESGVKIFNRIYGDMRADSIGASIVNDVAKQLGVQIGNLASIKINGQETVQNHVNSLDKKYAELSAALKNFENLPQEISNAVKSNATSKPEQLNSAQNNTETKDKSVAAVQDYSKQLSQIITGVQDATTAVNNGVNSLISTVVSLNNSKNTEITDSKGILSALSDNTSALGQGSEAILRLVNSIGEINVENNHSSTVKDYSFDFVNVIKEIQNLSSGLSAIQSVSQSGVNAIDEVLSAVNSVEAAVKSQSFSQGQEAKIDLSPVVSELQGILVFLKSTQSNSSNSQDFSSALSPVITALQNISANLASVQNAAQSNIQAVNNVASAVNSVENTVKSQQSDNISINEGSITQAVITGVTPLISRIEQNSSTYQASSAAVLKSIQDLGMNIETLIQSADSSNSALVQIQASVQAAGDSYNTANITNAINPLAAIVQNLAGILVAIQNINQASNSAVLDVLNSVRSLENTVKSLDVGNNYDIDINQQGFMIEKKSDADMLARSTVSALRSGLGNGGI